MTVIIADQHANALAQPTRLEINRTRRELYRLALLIGSDGVPWELMAFEDDALIGLCKEMQQPELARLLIATARLGQRMLAITASPEQAATICGTLAVDGRAQPLTFAEACARLATRPRIIPQSGKLPPEGVAERSAILDGTTGGRPWTATLVLMSYLRLSVATCDEGRSGALPR
jgi:hypothetical protein